MCLWCGRSIARAVYGHVISYGAPHARSLRARGAPLLKTGDSGYNNILTMEWRLLKSVRVRLGPVTICALTKGADPCRVL